VIPDLIEQYVDTGKVRYVYREFPLNNIHPTAQKASEAAVCAGELGSYWEMNEQLYATAEEWSAAEDPTAYFKEYADEIGLDAAAFSECLDSGWAEDKIEADRLAGHELEVNATPYFFVNDLAIRGGLPIEPLGQVIDFVAAGGVMADIIPVGDDYHVFGDGEMAMSVAVVFDDYASPESAKNARDMLPVLEQGYIDTGDMIYVVHPWAQDAESPGGKAAIAAECAGEQGLYREMHGLLLEEQDSWLDSEEPNALFVASAESLSSDLDSSAFEACLDSEEAWLRVQASTVLAALNNLPGIPFFVFNNGQGWLTAQTADEFKALLESNLSQ
jgi:protein-disulfide isomerase